MQQTFGGGLPRRLMSLLVTLAMVVGLVPGQGLREALAADPVTYLDYDADGKPTGQGTCGDYATIDGSSASWGEADKTTWYVADGAPTIGTRVSVAGDVRLILKDNANLTCSKGIELTGGNSLTVYAQSEGESMGRLTAFAGGDNLAGIGGSGGAGGALTVNGGSVTANGGWRGAGIGGGDGGAGGTTTVNGGSVEATGGVLAAGIGGGNGGAGGTTTVNGGSVTANGGTCAAGIGGGYRSAGGAVTIAGGTVAASGNAGGGSIDGGAGIGGGEGGDSSAEGNFVSITGGTVTAAVPDGTEGAAIGNGGDGGTDVPITFGEGAIVTAGTSADDAQDVADVASVSNNADYKYARVEFPAPLTGPVTYLDFDADGKPAGQGTCEDYAVVSAKSTSWGEAGKTTWYVADGAPTISSRVSVAGDVRLILMDNAKLTCNGGIELTGDNSLTVYAQSEGEFMGRLTATASDEYTAGIGGGSGATGGTVTVNGGAVAATGGWGAAGIGGGIGGAGGATTVNGGAVTANGGDYGAGVGGGGDGGVGGTVTVNGGEVVATGGYSSAGIGGGQSGAGGTVTVNGGAVTATGGAHAAGIGGGYMGASGAVTIAGGTVAAIGNAGGASWIGGAGIGGGDDGNSSAEGNFVSITGGTVTASVPDGTKGAAIGNGGGTSATDVPITFGEGAIVTAGTSADDAQDVADVASVPNNLAYKYARVWFLPKQAIEAADVSAAYGETGKAVSARVTEPADGSGAISYAVREGSEGYIDVDASTGALTIKGVPADGKAHVTVTAAGTATHARTTKDVTVTISKAASSVATVPAARELTYDGRAQALVTAGTAVGGELRYALGGDEAPEDGWGAAVPTAKDAGDYRVWYRVVGDANHNDAAPARVAARVAPRVVGLRWSGTKLTYDGAKQGPKATATGLLAGDKCSVTVSGAAKDAGTHTATATGLSNPNYALPAKATAKFTIAKAKLTVTAKDKKISQGDAPANAGVTYKGLVGSDTAKSLGGRLSFDYGGYRKGGKAGRYEITPKGLTSKNYAIAYKKGTLTVTKAAQKLPASTPATAKARVDGRGWVAADSKGVFGTTGRSLMLTGLRLRLSDAPLAGSIQYRSHVQGPGWEKAWSADGATSGAAGKRTEAVRIRLTGAMAKQYDVWYRAHVQRVGWMAWAKDGEAAGTAGMSRRVEALQVVVLRKGSKAPAKDYKGIKQDHAKAFLSK